MGVRVTVPDLDRDPDIEDIAALEPDDGSMLYWASGGSRYNKTASQSYGRSLLNAASASAAAALLVLTPGTDVMARGFNTYALASAATLVDTALYPVYGRTAAGDGGFGFFRYVAGSSATVDDGITLSAVGGRLVRVFDETIHAVWFVATNSSSDQSTKMQAALTAASGKTLILAPGIVFCKALKYPQQTTIRGHDNVASGLKLPDASDTFVWAPLGYTLNEAFPHAGSLFENFALIGNSANQSSAQPLEIVRGYREVRRNITYTDSKGVGCLQTVYAADGSTIIGSSPDCIWDRCVFEANKLEGFRQFDDGQNKLADGLHRSCVYAGNGSEGSGSSAFNASWDRAAGWVITDPQAYSPHQGNFYVRKGSRLTIRGGVMDIAEATAASGTVANIDIQTSGDDQVLISTNLVNVTGSAGSLTWRHVVANGTTATARVVLNGCTFLSSGFSHQAYEFSGSGLLIDVGNAFAGTTRPSSSASIIQGLDTSGVGSIVQAYHARLADVAAVGVTDNAVLIGNGSNLVLESGATLKTSLGLTIGTDVQAYHARLADVAAVGVTDNAVLIGNGSNLVLESGSTLLTSIGLGTGNTPQFTGVEIGHASDTTLTRVAAGRAAIEGHEIANLDQTQTFTGVKTTERLVTQYYEFANLPTGTGPGQRAFCIDSNTASFNATVAGGGGNYVPVFFDGSVWKVG